MMSRIKKFARPFRRDEDGNATIEFALYFTVFFVILSAGVELAYLNLRHAMLERGVDLVTRDIRLSTGHTPTYDEVRQRICDNAVILTDCSSSLRLEMIQVDPRGFTAADPGSVDCQNSVEEPHPVRNFVHGQDNEIMLIRACLKFKPIMPSTSLGKALNKDSDGFSQLVVTSAFVQEPR